MQCEDNSKLRIPLSEVCQTTDIGCVPITDGKPTCTVQPDELPIAFDPNTTTLWLFSCKTREWIPFQKFTVCQLNALNLENITNICDVLNIAVNYAGSGECQQGTVSLRELAERILECLTLETKIITIGQGEGNKVKISIEGLPLDPVYVQGENIWSEGGSGTEADPLIVATYDPICKWPIKNQSEVDAADTKHLGACLDGEMSRVPFPPKICELPPRNQEQVDSAQSVELAACVDGEEVKIPYVKPSPPVCDSDQITLEQAKAKGSALTLVGCDNGNVVRIPVSQSGFFDRDYICVPEVVGKPSEAPIEGTGPLRVDCDGNMYAWVCDSNTWVTIKGEDYANQPGLNPNDVTNICENLKIVSWYRNGSDDCTKTRSVSIKQLMDLIESCAASGGCNLPFENQYADVICFGGPDPSTGISVGRTVGFNDVTLTATGNANLAVYQSSVFSFIRGNGTLAYPIDDDNIDKGVGENKITLVNNTNCRMYCDCDLNLSMSKPNTNADFSVSAFCTISDVSKQNYYDAMNVGVAGWPPPQTAFSGFHAQDNYIVAGSWDRSRSWGSNSGILYQGKSMINPYWILNPGESKDVYIQLWIVIGSRTLTTLNRTGGFAVHGSVNVRKYRGFVF